MDNLDFGLWMTAMGMGTVFLLLIVLMLVLQLMGRLDRRPEPKPEPVEAAAAVGDTDGPPGVLTEDEIAAITVAVTTHARIRRAQAAPEMRAHEPGSHLFASRWVGIGRGFQQQPWSRG
jgi:sodium pump decarboxylase gamma subunit